MGKCYFDAVPPFHSEWFTWYWNILGIHLSRGKGWIVDRMPFSMVEATVWLGLLCLACLAIAAATGRWQALRRRRGAFALIASGPVILFLLGLGQGAFPLSMAPTAWRTPLARIAQPPALPYDTFRAELRRRENRALRLYGPTYYGTLSEEEMLAGCDQGLDRLLGRLNLTPGRTVRKVKPMGPLTSLLGLSYGGPAFHDPFYGELAMVSERDHPAPRYWRLLGVCHEAAHAKGFTREMDAEILTQLVLSTSQDPRYLLLGDIMFLRKSGEKVHLPEGLRKEILASRDSLKAAERRQWGVRWLKSLARRLGFQNSGSKYGTRNPRERWNPEHPFFSTVAAWLPVLGPVDGP